MLIRFRQLNHQPTYVTFTPSLHIRQCHPQCHSTPLTDPTSNSTLHADQASTVFRPSCPHSVLLYSQDLQNCREQILSPFAIISSFHLFKLQRMSCPIFSLPGPRRISTLHHQNLSIWSPSDSDSQVPVRSSLKVSQLLFSKLVGQVKSKRSQ